MSDVLNFVSVTQRVFILNHFHEQGRRYVLLTQCYANSSDARNLPDSDLHLACALRKESIV